jgi:8-oxo-dGTP diphosphatase
VGCYVIIENREAKYLVIITNKQNGYEFPGGGCNFDETLQECAIREAREESGYDVELVTSQCLYVTENFVYSRRRKEYWKKIDFLFKSRLRSTTQHNLILEEGEEVLEMRWVSIEEMRELEFIYFIEDNKEEIITLLNTT